MHNEQAPGSTPLPAKCRDDISTPWLVHPKEIPEQGNAWTRRTQKKEETQKGTPRNTHGRIRKEHAPGSALVPSNAREDLRNPDGNLQVPLTDEHKN